MESVLSFTKITSVYLCTTDGKNIWMHVCILKHIDICRWGWSPFTCHTIEHFTDTTNDQQTCWWLISNFIVCERERESYHSGISISIHLGQTGYSTFTLAYFTLCPLNTQQMLMYTWSEWEQHVAVMNLYVVHNVNNILIYI